MDTCSKRKVSLEGNANSGLITNINMNSKKSCTQLKNELHYEALCLKYKSTYHPPTFNKRKDERQQRLQVMRSDIYSCCEQERAMKCETPSNLSNTSCSTSVQMFSTTSNPDDSIKDSGIGISSVSIDENDIDFTCLTDTIAANSIHTKHNLDAQVKSVLKAPSVGVSHFIANDINASVKQTMNIGFDVLELDKIDMMYKIKSDEACVQFEPPKLNESKEDKTRRLNRMKKRIAKAAQNALSQKEMIDMKYKVKSDEAGVQFDPPKLNESQDDRTRRLNRMKKRIAKAAKTVAGGKPAKSYFQNSLSIIDPQVQIVVSTLVETVDNILQGQNLQGKKSQNAVPSSNLINLNATSGSASSFTNISSNESASQQVRSAELETLHSNPKVLEAISEFETGETRHKICKCIVCDERRPVFNVIKNKVQAGKPRLTEFKNWSVDRKSVCERCKKDRKSKTLSAPRFSGCNSDNVDILPGALGHNNMHFEKVPDFLEGLTLVEVALISKITTIMKISMRKYGMLSSKGHSVSIPQNMKIARSLPLLPEEVGLVVLQRKNDKSKIKAYSVQRHKVENALKGLCFGFPHGGNLHESDETPLKYTGPDHIDRILNNRYFKFLPNRFYCDVNIIQTRLNELPIIRASYPGLTVLPVKSSNDNDSDNAEQPQIDDDTQSGIMILDPQNSEQHLLNFLTKLLGGDKEAALKAINEGEVGAVNWDKVQGEPLHELKTPGFFCMSYPNIFINGSCDITIPGLSSIKFDDWVQHIYYATDNRVAQHPFLKFHLLNLNMRHKALNQGSFLVAQQLDDAHLSLSELKDNFEAGDYSVPRKIISVGKNLTNTAPYWADVKRNLDALTFHRRLKNKNMPAYFTTGSCAEHHFVALHLLLADYHATINNLPLQDVIDQMKSDPAFKHKIITKNLHIITNYFQARTHNFFVTVGKELYLWDDLWFRFEFAKQRGEIHFHGLMWSDKHSSIIEEALRPLLSDRAATSEAALNLKEFLQIQGCYQGQDIYSPEFQSMHPGGGNEVITSSGNMDWIPNKSKWAPPEGTYTNNSNPLSISINDCVQEEGAMMSHLVDLVNRLSLHQCTTSYCLKTKSKNSEVKFCRFHFGEYDPVTKQCSGKDLHPFHPEITAGDHPRYDGNRDHPRMIQHVPAHLFAWKANCDIQPVVDTDLHALLNYLGEYACKANVTSAELMRMYQVIMGASNDSASVRSIAQKLLLKTCGCIDVSASAADYINTSGPMHRSSRTFTRVGLSGYRILRDCEVQGTVTSKNKVDKFLQEERRLRKPEQTLYDFCTECDCNCKTEHIPVFTGLPIIPKWPPTVQYCKAMLMIFSRGTWYKESDLMGPYDNFPQAFADFIETEDCPETVKELLEAAKAAHDRKRNKVVNRQAPSTSAPESQSQSQNSQSSSQCENEFGLSRALMRDFAMSHAQELDNPTTEQELNHGPPNYDWHAEGLATFNTFVQDLSILDSAETWLAKTEQDIQKVLNDHNDRLNLPERDPLACNELQRIALGINMEQMLNVYLDPDNTPQCILVVQGAGGTGKSFIIETATRIARRLFGRNGAVLNLAPTGAAAVLLPDGRTIHSVINIPTMQRRKKKAGKDTTTHQVSDFPMSRDQIKKLQTITGVKGDQIKLKMLNMDERSQHTQEMVNFTSDRFCEATTDNKSLYGGISMVNWFGDISQLGGIGSKDLPQNPGSYGSSIAQKGYSIYRSLENVLVLEQSMRQKEDQVKLKERLDRMRLGFLTDSDWTDINNRYEKSLSHAEQNNFNHFKTLTVVETWREADIENRHRLAQLGVPIARVLSQGRGRHHKGNLKQMGQIPHECLIANNSAVIMSKNQNSLTTYGLNNGSPGIVKAILYRENEAPPSFPMVVIVDFDNYTGPPWLQSYPTWVPIVPVETRCDSECCTRIGLPLLTSYALPIAKVQGRTIGDGQSATHLRVKLQSDTKMEQLSLGLAYTAFSRCQRDTDWCLVDLLPRDRLTYINKHPLMKTRQGELARLQALSTKTVAKFDMTESKFMYLLRQIDTYANDGINDAICLKQKPCNCVACRN